MTFEPILTWLDRFKPLWEFLTGIGTVGAVCVSLWLALRRPKARLEVVAHSTNDDKALVLTITNVGDTAELVLSWYWRAKCLGKGGIALKSYPVLLNGPVALPLPQRMQKFDVLTITEAIDAIATIAEQVIPKPMADADVDDAIAKSWFGCATSSGRLFETPTPDKVAKAIAGRIRLIRKAI